ANPRGRPPGARTSEGAVPGAEHPPPGGDLRVLPRRGRRADADGLRGRPRHAARVVCLPAAGPRRLPLPERLRGAAARWQGDRLRRVHGGDDGARGDEGGPRVVRGGEVPGLPVSAWTGGGVGGGAGRILPPATAPRVGHCRGRRDGGPQVVQGALPRVPLLIRLPGVPEPGGPGPTVP